MRSIILAASAVALCVCVPVQAELIYGISNFNAGTNQQRLFTFDSATRAVGAPVIIQAPAGSSFFSLRSIDVRPATGELFGIGFSDNQLYRVNPATGALTAIGAPQSVSGAIDFNPTVDRIRLVGRDTTTNLRIDPDTGVAITDGALAYQAGDSGAGLTPNIRSIAYTNSSAGATATTLYDIDVNRDILATQNPANNGTLQTVGPLGVDVNGGSFGTFVGFDISGATGAAYLTDGGANSPANLYTLNLATGAATLQGTITGFNQGTIADIAVAAVPEPTTLAVLALTGGLLLRRRA